MTPPAADPVSTPAPVGVSAAEHTAAAVFFVVFFFASPGAYFRPASLSPSLGHPPVGKFCRLCSSLHKFHPSVSFGNDSLLVVG